MSVIRRRPLVAIGAALFAVSAALAVAGAATAGAAASHATAKTRVCTGKGYCDVASFSPQIICYAASKSACGLPNDPVKTTLTIEAYRNGTPTSAVNVDVVFDAETSPQAGEECNVVFLNIEKANHGYVKAVPVKNKKGFFSVNYNAPASGVPNSGTFCNVTALVYEKGSSKAKATIVSAIDQTDDPAPWTVAGTPTPVTLLNDPSDTSDVHLQVTNPNASPTYVNNDATTIFSEIPSTVGACGSITPSSKRSGPTDLNGRATFVYAPTTVGGTPPSVSCTIKGQEADTGAVSNKIIIYQKK